ncbi:hypothetical protein [Mycobacterium neglectum]|jgi:hypothetical protein|uniref:hypothetical protein n=1 Tax=Mycobacterium neglectum TaxID=242737 RepID=UPI000BFEBE3D|nr:hypothetical protein [Mycobacterium neglectum]
MRKGWGLLATIALTGVALAPAGVATAQPASGGNAYQTIGQLESVGYNVVIDRVGNAPIGECFVTNVRNPQEVTQTFPVRNGGKGDRGDKGGYDRDYVTVVVSRSITVSLNCDV